MQLAIFTLLLLCPSKALLEWLSPEDWVQHPPQEQQSSHIYQESVKGANKTSANLSQTLGSLADSAVAKEEALRESAAGLANRVKDAVSETGEAVGNRAGRLKDRIKDASRSFRQRMPSWRHYWNDLPFSLWDSDSDSDEEAPFREGRGRRAAINHDDNVLSEPALSVWKSYPDAYFLFTNVPGIPASHLNLTMLGKHLFVEGSHKACLLEHQDDDHDRICVDRYLHTRHRLPPDVDREKISAFIRDGVLVVRMGREVSGKNDIKRVPIGSQSLSWGQSVMEHLGLREE